MFGGDKDGKPYFGSMNPDFIIKVTTQECVYERCSSPTKKED